MIVLGVVAQGASCRSVTEPSKDLVVVTSVARPTVAVGDTVTLTLTITNPAAVPESVFVFGCPPPFQVVQAGAVVGPDYYTIACTLPGLTHPREILPGGQVTFSYLWNGSAIRDDLAVPASLVPGDYSVEAVLASRQIGSVVVGKVRLVQ